MSSSLHRDAVDAFDGRPRSGTGKEAWDVGGAAAEELPNLLSKSLECSRGDNREAECERMEDHCAGTSADDSSCVARARSTSIKMFSAHSRDIKRRAGDCDNDDTIPAAYSRIWAMDATAKIVTGTSEQKKRERAATGLMEGARRERQR
jgi:hypothetical protein